jgi:hypothetical protein
MGPEIPPDVSDLIKATAAAIVAGNADEADWSPGTRIVLGFIWSAIPRPATKDKTIGQFVRCGGSVGDTALTMIR